MPTTYYNFNPGPSALPDAVREEVLAAINNFSETGIGILETSHRSGPFEALLSDTQSLLRKILQIPDSHEIIFCPGGASLQFAMVPLNLLEADESADYLLTGAWAEKAMQEACKLRNAQSAASSKEHAYQYIPKDWKADEAARYLHYTSNNTIFGTQYHFTPEKKNALLVCDASSDFCSMPIDFDAIDLLYAGAQKNVGTAGITVVIARTDLLSKELEHVPSMLQYLSYFKTGSLYNTPSTIALFTLHAMLRWIAGEGGLPAMHERAKQRSARVYDILDSSELFRTHAALNDRSMMNVSFDLQNREQVPQLLAEAEAAGLVGLAGHRSIGGLRASLYNGLPERALEALTEFLSAWTKKHG